MSFGFGVGDIGGAVILARKLYKKCRDSPAKYKDLADDARQLELVLDDLKDLVQECRIKPAKEAILLEFSSAGNAVLLDANKMLDDYKKMSSKSKGVVDRLGWDQDDARDIRSRMMSSVTMLTAFYQSLQTSECVQIQKKLDLYLNEVRQGHRDTDSISLIVAKDKSNEDSAWDIIIEELEEVGLTTEVVRQNRHFIIELIREAFDSGKLDNISTDTDGLSKASKSVSKKRDRWIITAPAVESPQGLLDSHRNSDFATLTFDLQEIVRYWNSNQWSVAAEAIVSAEKKLVLQRNLVDRPPSRSTNSAADIKLLLRHLRGIAHSFSGDSLKARCSFNAVRGQAEGYLDLESALLQAASTSWLGENQMSLGNEFDALELWSKAIETIRTIESEQKPTQTQSRFVRHLHMHLCHRIRTLLSTDFGRIFKRFHPSAQKMSEEASASIARLYDSKVLTEWLVDDLQSTTIYFNIFSWPPPIEEYFFLAHDPFLKISNQLPVTYQTYSPESDIGATSKVAGRAPETLSTFSRSLSYENPAWWRNPGDPPRKNFSNEERNHNPQSPSRTNNVMITARSTRL